MPNPAESWIYYVRLARVARDLLKALAIHQIQLSEDLQLIERT